MPMPVMMPGMIMPGVRPLGAPAAMPKPMPLPNGLTPMVSPLMVGGGGLAAAKAPGVGGAPALTTCYVGRLPPGLEDEFVRSLLEQCGRVIKWNCASDPNSGKLTTFGFCEFETLEGVWKAREALHGQFLLDKEILVKCEDKSVTQVDAWKVIRKTELKREIVAKAKEPPKEEKAEDDGDGSGEVKEEQAEGEVKEEKKEETPGVTSAAPVPAVPPPPVVPGVPPPPIVPGVPTQVPVPAAPAKLEPAKDATIDISQVPDEDAETALEDSLDTCKEAIRALVKERNAKDGRSSRRERSRSRRRDRERDRDREREREKEKEKEKAEEKKDTKDGDKESKDKPTERKEADWKRWKLQKDHRTSNRERERIRKLDDAKRELDREYDKRQKEWLKEEERLEQLDAKEQAKDRDRQREKRKLVDKDLHDDAACQPVSKDRRRKREEEEDRDRKAEREEEKARDREKDKEKKRARDEKEAREKEREEALRADREEQESALRKAQEQARKIARDQEALKREDEARKQEEAERNRVAPMGVGGISIGGSKPQTQAAFGDEDKPKPAEEPKVSSVDEKKRQMEATKALIAQIPSSKEDIFAYPINWRAVQEHSIIEKKLKPWVKKKVVEYLGAEEDAMIEFIIKKVEARSAPDAILNELIGFLDDEAEGFVVKMWRMIIFEVLRCNQ